MKKNKATTNITAHHCPCDVYNIISENKDSNYSLTANTIEHQESKIIQCLADVETDGKTRLMVARETGIERASVCRRIADLRKSKMIWSCGVRKCAISKTRAEYLTTNYRVALRHFCLLCKDHYINLNGEEQCSIIGAIKAYCIDGQTSIDLFGLDNGRCRDIWENEVKPLIDREYGNK